MAQIINITDRLNDERPIIQIGDKQYPVNNSLDTVFRFGDLAGSGDTRKSLDAVALALGDKAADEIDAKSLSMESFRVLITAIMAAMQGLSYEDAAARFQRAQPTK